MQGCRAEFYGALVMFYDYDMMKDCMEKYLDAAMEVIKSAKENAPYRPDIVHDACCLAESHIKCAKNYAKICMFNNYSSK